MDPGENKRRRKKKGKSFEPREVREKQVRVPQNDWGRIRQQAEFSGIERKRWQTFETFKWIVRWIRRLLDMVNKMFYW